MEQIKGYGVELEYDPEVGTWHFRVPDLHIVGGGQKTLEEARIAAGDAIDFSLEEPTNTELL